MKINLLDCTLRDGGYLNDWEFGENSIRSIFRSLVKSNLEAFEVGFLDDRRPYDKNRAIYPNTESICEFYSNESKGNVFITAMTTGLLHDGHCSLDSIGDCNNSFIDGIRVPFKQEQLKEAIDYCYGLKEKGYKVFVNPTSITTYSDREMLDLIELVNNLEPYSMAIVDTYGLLFKERLFKYFYLLDTNLKENISIAYHAHNNFQLAFSNSSELLKIRSKRNVIIDSSLYGMAKSAGNCNTELFAQYLNEFYDRKYNIPEILKTIELHILKYMKTNSWGYNLSYYISAYNKCHPNYVKFLEDKNTLDTEEINEILSQIAYSKALTYDKEHIQKLYTNYQNRKNDYNEICKNPAQEQSNKTIVFDVDGTLLDTRPGIINAVKFVIEKYNLKELTDEEMQKFIGLSPIQASFNHFCGTDEKLSQKCAEEYREQYKKGDVYKAEIYKGIFELLDYLKQNGYKIGIATYKRQDNINQLTEKFGLKKYFDSVCGADNDNKLTKTDIIKNCISEMKSDTNEVIMIGDSKHDAEAAEKLQVKFIGVTYGFGFKTSEEVNQHQNILCANNTSEILNYFKSAIKN